MLMTVLSFMISLLRSEIHRIFGVSGLGHGQIHCTKALRIPLLTIIFIILPNGTFDDAGSTVGQRVALARTTSGKMVVIGRKCKTYSSEDSPMVTHLTTSSPVQGLSTGERTGSSIFLDL